MLMGLCEAESADGAAEMWIHFIKIGYHQFSKMIFLLLTHCSKISNSIIRFDTMNLLKIEQVHFYPAKSERQLYLDTERFKQIIDLFIIGLGLLA